MNRRKYDLKQQEAARGFTLIEALVALLVLSLGLLGVAAMQLKALQGSHVSFQRTIATLAAQDAAERLWVELGIYGRQCPNPSSEFFTRAEDGELLNPLVHITQWQNDWGVHLPLRSVTLIGYRDESEGGEGVDEDESVVEEFSECEYSVVVGWQDERFVGEDVSELNYRVRLPGR